jgi:hypothetical protein
VNWKSRFGNRKKLDVEEGESSRGLTAEEVEG